MYEKQILEKLLQLERDVNYLKRLDKTQGITDHGLLAGLGDHDHTQYVRNTENETINGIKTFGSIPVLPGSDPTSDNQAVRKAYVDILANAPMVRVRHSTTQSIPNITTTILNFNTEDYDNNAMHDNVTNNTRLTCKTAGLYEMYANIRLSGQATNTRLVHIVLNGTDNLVSSRIYSPGEWFSGQVLYTQFVLDVNDYIEVHVYQNTGATITTEVVGYANPSFGMRYLQPAA